MSNDFIDEFMEDYFIECEEHLTSIRNQLLALESLVNQPHLDLNIINNLFRSFHTIKGLSAMVGIQAAEELSHEMESYLRILRDESGIILPIAGFDSLIEGTKALETVIQRSHNHQNLPDISLVLAKLQSLIPQSKSQEVMTIEEDSIIPELQAGIAENIHTTEETTGRNWHFVFSPSPDLTAKDINVNTIRSRLQTIGEIVQSSPRMGENNKIVFDFIVATNTPETSFSSWKEEGLSWELSTITEEDSVVEPPAETITKDDTNSDSGFIPVVATLVNQSTSVVRVDLPKLDELMRMVGELVISRAKLEDSLRNLRHVSDSERRSLKEINLTLERQLRDLREGVMRVRLVPMGDAFARMQFVVRDLVRETNKDVTLEISGQETEIDKFVVERMMDPLLHLVRNAISHGIETKQERQAKGKPPQGKITLRAKTSGETVIIEIEDDGRGIDIEKVIQRGKAKGLITESVKDTYDLLTILDVLCSPGFSTKEEVDLVSGRGVGMAIVQTTVNELGGSLNLATEKDAGTCYTIQLPLTLAIADALIISVAGQIFAIPQTSVREVTDIYLKEITTFENNQIFSYRDKVLSLTHLAKYFALAQPSPNHDPDFDLEKSLRVVIIGNELNSIGIVIDKIIGLREIVVRPLTDPFVQVTGIAGATELGDGKVVLILDVSALIRTAGIRK